MTIAREWNARKVPTVTGAQWYASTVRAMFLNPRVCGMVVYRGEIMNDAEGKPVRGRWESVMTDEEYESVVRVWSAAPKEEASRLEGKGSGYRTKPGAVAAGAGTGRAARADRGVHPGL